MALYFALNCASIASAQDADGQPEGQKGFPVPGTTWVIKSTSFLGTSLTASGTVTHTVFPDVEYKGRQVHRMDVEIPASVGVVQRSTTFLIDKDTRNVIGHLSGSKETSSASPHEGKFDWPLRVGKSWTAIYTHSDGAAVKTGSPYERSGLVRILWSVESYEDMTVPAGRFKVFKLRSSAADSKTSIKGRQFTVWYAPAIHIAVRTEGALRPRGGVVIRFVGELMKFTPPQ